MLERELRDIAGGSHISRNCEKPVVERARDRESEREQWDIEAGSYTIRNSQKPVPEGELRDIAGGTYISRICEKSVLEREKAIPRERQRELWEI